MTRLRWLGHSTVLLETGGVRVLTDPVLGAGVGPIRRRASNGVDLDVDSVDVVLVSHLHHDHLHLPSFRLLPRHVRVVVPRGAGRLVARHGFRDVEELDAGGSIDGAVSIRAVPARHSGRRVPFGPDAPALGYVIDGEHQTYFAGDTDLFPEMGEVAAGADLALIPVGGWGPTLRGGHHLDPTRAAAALRLLRPRTAVAIHWGTLWPLGLRWLRSHRFERPAQDFIEEALRVAPDVDVPLLAPGDELELPPRAGQR